MARKSLLSLPVILILLVFAFTGKASAASLYFAVPAEVVNVTITEQGTMAIDYLIDFDNNQGGSVIDYVDIGLPNQSYVLSSITADVDGKSITDIQKGDPQYIAIGVTLGLGSNAIQPGQKGRLHLSVGQVGQMLYPYTGDNKTGYVSFEFVPNTFGSQYVTGSTDLTLSLHLPKGVQPEEPVYFPASNGWPGATTPDGTLDDQGRVTYTWHAAGANVYTQYKFGGAFPAKYIPASTIVQPVNNTNTNSFPICGLIEVLLCIGIFFFIIVGIIKLLTGSSRIAKKMTYLPPKIAVEGLGVKRGLTPVEVAVLMELPVDKILTMILFSVIKKGAASIVSKDPLELEFTSPTPPDLHPYEIQFLESMNPASAASVIAKLQTDLHPDETNSQESILGKSSINDKLESVMVDLIKSVTALMQGFSRKETVAYYQDIITKAWAEVEAAGTPEVKSQKFDETMDWTMVDSNFDSRTRSIFINMPVIVPTWWGRYDPAFKSPAIGAVSAPSTASSGPANAPALAVPHLPGSDFAASIIKGSSDFSAKTISNVETFTANIARQINPSPPPPPSPPKVIDNSSGGSSWSSFSSGEYHSHNTVHISTHSGGGHHCACACAGGGR